MSSRIKTSGKQQCRRFLQIFQMLHRELFGLVKKAKYPDKGSQAHLGARQFPHTTDDLMRDIVVVATSQDIAMRDIVMVSTSQEIVVAMQDIVVVATSEDLVVAMRDIVVIATSRDVIAAMRDVVVIPTARDLLSGPELPYKKS
jgi:hypothetical protein